nr:hypothetical protein [Tanacetum cinerariifolium]
SNVENLLPIPSECEVALEDKRECTVPISKNFPDCDNDSDTFSDSKIDDDISVYDDDFEDIEYRLINLMENDNSDSSNDPLLEEANLFLDDNSIPPGIENVVDDPEGDIHFLEELLIDDFILSHELPDANFQDNPSISRPPLELPNDNFDLEPETRSSNTTHANYSLIEYDSFCFEIEPDQERLINLLKNDISDSSNDPLLEEIDLFLSDDSIPPGIENFADDPEGDIRFLEELLIDDSILSHELSDDNFEDNPSISRPPSEPSDIESFFDLKPDVIAEEISDKLNEDKCFDPGREINRVRTPSLTLVSLIRSSVQVVDATDDSPANPEHTTVETPMNMSLENKDHFEAEKEAIHLILTGIGDEVYSTVDAFQTAQEVWEAIERLQQEFPSSEIKVHIEVLSMLWGNRLLIRTVRCRCLGGGWTNWKMTRHHGTVAAVEGSVRGSEKSVRGPKNQYETTNALHNAIIEAGGKDRPPMLAPEDSSETTTEGYMENYKNVSQDIRDQMNAKAEAIQIILTGIDNDIYSTLDAYPNPCEIWKANERPTYDQKPTMVAEDDEMLKEKEIDKPMALISLSFKKIYKPTNNNLRTSSNTNKANQDNSLRINRGISYDNQRVVNIAWAKENVEQADWRDDTDDEPEDQELEAHYLYMVKIPEVNPDANDNSGSIFDTKPMQKV